MRKNRLPITAGKILDRLVMYGMKVPAGVESLPFYHIIKMLRHGLGMSQVQLAKRAGLAQSHLAEIELGHVDLQLSTLRKIFQALYCDTLVLPKFKKRPEIIIAERAKETARKKIARVSGSMALEDQLPDKIITRELIRSEEKRLTSRPSSEIWED